MGYLDFIFAQHTPEYWDSHWEELLNLEDEYQRNREYRMHDYYESEYFDVCELISLAYATGSNNI